MTELTTGDDLERLARLFYARHPFVSILTYEEAYALGLVRELARRFNRPLRVWSVTTGLYREGDESGIVHDTEHPAAALYYLAHQEPEVIGVTLDLAEHLKEPRTLRALRDLVGTIRRYQGMLVMIDSRDDLPEVVSVEASRFEPSYPDEQELLQIVTQTLRTFHQAHPIKIEISRRDLDVIIRNLRGLTRREAEQVIIDAVAEDRKFQADDLHRILNQKRLLIQKGGLLEYIETPASLDEIGGLARLKRWLDQRRDTLSRDAASYGLEAPRGVLMLGVQGSGKSLCAKAIATAWRRPLLRMDVGALYDRYVGESERRLRDALRQAELMAPIILWIDEIEKAFAAAASRSTDGGLSQRMFGSLLTWMQEHRSPVFLVGTANDIEALPPELLRKGRFDEIFFVDLPTLETREKILAIHLRKRRHDPDQFDLRALAQATDGYSGAEIEQGIISALHGCFADRAELTTERVLAALAQSPPLSVTMREKVEALRAWAAGRCVPAD